jgi:uncharacterized protein (TIGR02246 family)
MKPSDKDDVLKANRAFYDAFEALDLDRMAQVWLGEDSIQCFHPGWRLLRGRDAVMKSWRRIFENTEEIQFVLTDVRVEVRGPIAYVTLYENISSRTGGEESGAIVLATNIFEKRAGRWYLTHHHGSPVVEPPARERTPTVH